MTRILLQVDSLPNVCFCEDVVTAACALPETQSREQTAQLYKINTGISFTVNDSIKEPIGQMPTLPSEPDSPRQNAMFLDVRESDYHVQMKVIVSARGRVTIPKHFRERLRIRPGETIDIEEERGQLVVRRVTKEDAVDALYGVLSKGASTEALLEELRGHRSPFRQG